MKYKLLDKLMPDTPNPKEVQDKIDAFLHNNEVDEDLFNGILADIELVGFAKGVKIGQEISLETSNDI